MEGPPAPAAPELAATPAFCSFHAFKLALNLVFLLLEFSSSRSSILPDPPESFPCSQRRTWVVAGSCPSVKRIFSVCSFADCAERVAAEIGKVMQNIPSFSLLSRLLAIASWVVTAAVGKGVCDFPRTAEVLLFYSHN